MNTKVKKISLHEAPPGIPVLLDSGSVGIRLTVPGYDALHYDNTGEIKGVGKSLISRGTWEGRLSHEDMYDPQADPYIILILSPDPPLDPHPKGIVAHR